MSATVTDEMCKARSGEILEAVHSVSVNVKNLEAAQQSFHNRMFVDKGRLSWQTRMKNIEDLVGKQVPKTWMDVCKMMAVKAPYAIVILILGLMYHEPARIAAMKLLEVVIK